MKNKNSIISTNYLSVCSPKIIGELSICGSIIFNIYENDSFIHPTPEQIKNLHDTFCIDVKLYDDNLD